MVWCGGDCGGDIAYSGGDCGRGGGDGTGNIA